MLWILGSIAFIVTYYFTARAIAYSFADGSTTDIGDWAFGVTIGLCCMCLAPITMCTIVFFYIDKGYLKAIAAHRVKVARLEQERREQAYKIQTLERSLQIGMDS